MQAMADAYQSPPSVPLPAEGRGKPVFSLIGVSKTYVMGELEVRALQPTDLEL
jgi:hypothetical protein